MKTVVKKSSTKKLGDFKKTYKSNTVLLGPVERHVVAKALDDEDRNPHALHPSEIAKSDACWRMMYYRLTDTSKELDTLAGASFFQTRIFEEGHDIHDKWQGWLWEMGRLYGYWQCVVCEYYWFAKSPNECVKCGAPRWKLRYKEVPIFSEEHLIEGHADGLVDEGLIEVKSIGTGTLRFDAPGFHEKLQSGEWSLQETWNNIRRPFPSHVRQGMLYAFCKKIQKVIFIYECKWNQAVKEFVVGFDEEIIEPILDKCLDLKYALKKHRVPDRPEWAGVNVAACKACPYRSVCYGQVQNEDSDQSGDTIASATSKKYRIKQRAPGT